MVAISPEVALSAFATARRIRSCSASVKKSSALTFFIALPVSPVTRSTAAAEVAAPTGKTSGITTAAIAAAEKRAAEISSPSAATKEKGQEQPEQEAADCQSRDNGKRQSGKSQPCYDRQTDGANGSGKVAGKGAEEYCGNSEKNQEGK